MTAHNACTSRTAEYEAQVASLAGLSSPAAKEAVRELKARISTLRRAHNEAVQINRRLPPELLMEIFSQIDASPSAHASFRQVLWVCT